MSMMINDTMDNMNENIPYEYAVTNFEQVDNVNMKHPLMRSWTLWFNNIKNDVDWTESLKQVHTFNSIEDFWCLYNNIKSVEELLQMTNKFEFSLFRKDVAPMAENEANHQGGRIVIILDKSNDLDSVWLNSMLFIIGENFENSADINGIVLSVKGRTHKLAFWTRCRSPEKIDDIQNDIQRFMPTLSYTSATFNEHRSY